MDRTTVIALMTTQYQAVTAELNIPEGVPAVLGAAVDSAFRAMGVQEPSLSTATAADGQQTVDLLALVDYYTLEALLRHVPTFADIQAYTPAIAKKRSQIFQQLRLLRDDAARRVAAVGYTAVGSDGIDSWQMARVTLDFLEPNNEGF